MQQRVQQLLLFFFSTPGPASKKLITAGNTLLEKGEISFTINIVSGLWIPKR